MDKAITNLGNKELHKRHSILIEGGNIPRAKVMDQHVWDRYLMTGDITLRQHRAAEYLLGQAAKAGLWATGVDLSRTPVQGGEINNVPFSVFPYGRTIVMVRRRYGHMHAYIVQEVVCYDYDVSHDDGLMQALHESLDWIADRRMCGVPFRRFEKAIKKEAQASAPPT